MSCLCLGDSFGIYSDRYGLRFCAGAFWTRVVFFPSSLYSVMFGTLIGILRYTLTKKDLLTFSELLRYFLEILLAFSRRSSKIPRGSFCFIPSCFSSGGRRRSKGRGRVKGIRWLVLDFVLWFLDVLMKLRGEGFSISPGFVQDFFGRYELEDKSEWTLIIDRFVVLGVRNGVSVYSPIPAPPSFHRTWSIPFILRTSPSSILALW